MIQMEPRGDKEIIREAENKGVELHSFAEIEDRGVFKPCEPNPPEPTDLATIMVNIHFFFDKIIETK